MRHAGSAGAGSTLPCRHLELGADGPPDRLGVLAVGQRLLDGAAREGGQHVVPRQGVGIRVAEATAHPLPEVRQPHPDHSADPRAARTVGPGRSARSDRGTRTSRRNRISRSQSAGTPDGGPLRLLLFSTSAATGGVMSEVNEGDQTNMWLRPPERAGRPRPPEPRDPSEPKAEETSASARALAEGWPAHPGGVPEGAAGWSTGEQNWSPAGGAATPTPPLGNDWPGPDQGG